MAQKKTKIYFWLKIDRNFYKNMFIKKLRSIPGGDTYVVIYQRMLVEWVEDNGFITFEGIYETIAEEIAIQLDEDLISVQFTLDYFIKYGLIQVEENGDIRLNQVAALIDSETNWARYKKKTREVGNIPTKLENVQPMSNQCPTEIEIEKELKIDKEINIESESDKKAQSIYSPSLGIFEKIEMVSNKNFTEVGKKNLHKLIKDFGLDQVKTTLDEKIEDGTFNNQSYPNGIVNYIRAILNSKTNSDMQNGINWKDYEQYNPNAEYINGSIPIAQRYSEFKTACKRGYIPEDDIKPVCDKFGFSYDEVVNQ